MTNSTADTNSSSDIDSFLDSVWMEQGLAKNTAIQNHRKRL